MVTTAMITTLIEKMPRKTIIAGLSMDSGSRCRQYWRAEHAPRRMRFSRATTPRCGRFLSRKWM